MDYSLIQDVLPRLLGSVNKTLILAGVALVFGFMLAVPLALMRLSSNKILASTAYGYDYVFRFTPLLVQIFLIYYGSGQFRGALEQVGLWVFFREAWFCAIFALSLNTAAYTAEIIRGGIKSVPWGEVEAARSVGMSKSLEFRRIVFPIAMRQALPAYGNELMLMVKSTSLASTITILEVTGTAKELISQTFRPVEIFIIAGAIYLTINFVVSRLILLTEAKLSGHLRSNRQSKKTHSMGASS